MTITIDQSSNDVNLVFNIANVVETNEFRFTLTSQWSGLKKQNDMGMYVGSDDYFETTLVTTNDRYTELTIENLNPFLINSNRHLNGIYKYELLDYTQKLVIDEGLIKIITSPGGGNGDVSYVSDNENLEADTYFTPNY